MPNSINPGTSLLIGNKKYTFTPAPGFPEIPYAEVGRKAKVYRLQSGKDFHALKAFKFAFRKEESVSNCAAIDQYREIPGLKAAERIVLYPQDYPGLIAQYPDFTYAVLMPWMKGGCWYNTVSQKTAISAENSLKLAKSFVEILAVLEQRQMAHCDLSGSNFIYSNDFQHVELVDLEELFAPGLKAPVPLPAGTSGYSPKWIMENGCWSAGCDRFSAGILISEILAWRDERVRQKAYGETYFEGTTPTSEGEFGHKTERHGLMVHVLGEIHPKLVELFGQVWFANGIEQCPRIEEWQKALQKIPILQVEPEALDFGTIKEGETVSVTLKVTNAGGGTLSGEIIPQEQWVQVSPSQFKCAKGKQSSHQVSFNIKTSGLSKFLHEKSYNRDDFLIIKSNANNKEKIIGSKFIIKKNIPVVYLFFLLLLAGFGIYQIVKQSLEFKSNVSQTVMVVNAEQTLEVKDETSTELTRPTKTPSVMPTPHIEQYSFDGFSSNFISNIKWRGPDSENSKLFQHELNENNELVLERFTSSDEAANYVFYAKPDRDINNAVYFEAKVKLLEGSGFGFVKIQHYIDTKGENWGWTQCGLGMLEKQPVLFCDVFDQNFNQIYYVEESANSNQWYTIKIIINPDTAQFNYFFDDHLIGFFSPENPEDYFKARYMPLIGLWTNPYATIKAVISDVQVSKR